jgi:hypothetical protein
MKRRTPARQHLGQDLNPLQILSAHLHPAQSVASNPDLRMGQRHFGFAELRHYCFAPIIYVAAKFKCPYLCKVEMSVVVVRWECGNRRSLAISIFPPLLIFVRVSNN